jgi:hypothetical protein
MLAFLVAGCDDHVEPGGPTGAVCPAGSTLTYDSFGRQFMTDFCVRCHSSTLMGAARMGAPLAHDFDTLAGVLLVADHIDQWAAAGPNATNTSMPPSDPRPTEAQRLQLGEWLACESATP